MTPQEYREAFPDASYGPGLATCQDPHEIVGAMFLFTEETACNFFGPFPGNYAAFRMIDWSIARVITLKERKYRANPLRVLSGDLPPYSSNGPSKEAPIQIFAYGNDDTTYTACFKTLREAVEVWQLLSASQPLDFEKDFKPFGFSPW